MTTNLTANDISPTDVAPVAFVATVPAGPVDAAAFTDALANDADADAIPACRASDGTCPEPRDRCPDAAEDVDRFEDSDGCPEPDNERDGIPDTHDKCPGQAETFNGRDDEFNVDLYERRAASVRAFLVAEGVEATRLLARGYGATRPIAPNGTEAGRAKTAAASSASAATFNSGPSGRRKVMNTKHVGMRTFLATVASIIAPGDATSVVAAAPSPIPADAPIKTHVVPPGNSAWCIAEKFYGRGDLYPIIQCFNDFSAKARFY